MSLNNKNKGSVSFVFYFIGALALLAVAGYYVGINEQSKLFKTIVEKKQQQDNDIINGIAVSQGGGSSDLSGVINAPIKSLIDSPTIVLRNIKNSNTSVNLGTTSLENTTNKLGVLLGYNVDQNSDYTVSILDFAKQSQYFIKTNENKNGVSVTLVNGEAKGNTCYNTATERLCFPHYKLQKIWSVADLNSDGIGDAIISVSATESKSGKQIVTDNFYMIISDPKSVKTNVSTSTGELISSLVAENYIIESFDYGVYSPIMSSADIVGGEVIMLGNFYSGTEALGKPSVSKVIRYKFGAIASSSEPNLESTNPYAITKIGEARLFKEQGESTSLWYPYNYVYEGLDFAFRAPDSWQREENFDKGVKIIFTETEGRKIVLETKSIVETCAEYNFNLSDGKNVVKKSAEFIDLGLFGVGTYMKYAINADYASQYHADICVTDKNNDKKVFSLYATIKEDGTPYYAIFDKIWSTFKIR